MGAAAPEPSVAGSSTPGATPSSSTPTWRCGSRAEGQVVGTISAQVDYLHNQAQREQAGHFGFFEVVDDAETAAALLATARDWLASRGMRIMRGPLSFSRNHGSGLVVAGESRPPMAMTTYNPPYYAGLCERFGLAKAQDSFAYLLNLTQFRQPGDLPPAIARFADLAARAQAEAGLQVRAMTWQTFAADMQAARQLYQRSFEQNWDFVPMTDAEFAQITTQLRQILDPAIVYCAEMNGKLVGMSLPLPDANQILRRLNGRLFPIGWLQALWLRGSGAITQARLMDLGVLPEHRGAGIEGLLVFETLRAAVLAGYRAIEFSWVLESNAAMNNLITYWGRDFGVRRCRTYRLYEMAL